MTTGYADGDRLHEAGSPRQHTRADPRIRRTSSRTGLKVERRVWRACGCTRRAIALTQLRMASTPSAACDAAPSRSNPSHNTSEWRAR
ncbi:hypothetical protein [Microbacterium invictum]|uniref:Uncharacterized protein n=1 Tax=Microbacterium invictum TaxID=515415 RepID=A0AA40VNN0_9MICO|nr:MULTISPECIES: hypothetical protein [Microbacterium]MBB4141047.1 hypothetical protein [Microbacterium invictum]